MVLWVLDLWPESLTAASKVRSPVLIRWVTRIVRQVYNSADVILMSSRSFAASIRSNTSDPDKSLEYLPNWAEDVFSKRGELPGSLAQALPEGFKVMFAGNLGEAQDFATILAAAQLTLGQAVNWLLVGSGRKVPWVQHQIAERGLTNVFLLGHHPIETMPLFFARADVMLLSLADNPIFRITVPAKLQAYMASGKVIIGVLAGEGADILRASGGGLVVSPGNAQALADAVLKVRQMTPGERLDIASKSRRYYEEHFAKEQRIDRLEELFERLAAEGGRREKQKS